MSGAGGRGHGEFLLNGNSFILQNEKSSGEQVHSNASVPLKSYDDKFNVMVCYILPQLKKMND